MNDFISGDTDTTLLRDVAVGKLIIARVISKEVIGNRTPPLIDFNAHADAVAIWLKTRVVIIKEIGF